MRSFDCLAKDCPLLGPHLLEASAGTGKTFAIEHVFVRLLLEEDPLQVEEILAVTFTKAATRDLKRRIRSNIEEALQRLTKGIGHWLYLADHVHSQSGWRKLSDALATVDRCQIFTIHGFCYRMLQEFAFEANLAFELADPDQERKIPKKQKREAVKFLESEIDPNIICPEQMICLLRRWDSLELLASALLKRGRKRDAVSFAELQARHDAIWASWQGGSFEEAKLLEDLERLSPCFKVKEGDFPSQVSALAKRDFRLLLKGKGSLFAFLKASNRKVKAKDPAFLHYPEFWNLAPLKFTPLIEETLDPRKIFAALQNSWEHWEKQLLMEELKKDPDMILEQMEEALQKPLFARKVREKYGAVIIDEFQDTDPVQWNIFQALFLQKKEEKYCLLPPIKALYLVGDPKQSIYRFRKADVYTYFQARNALGDASLFCLDTNYRSSPNLIRSLNALFSRNWLSLPKWQKAIDCPSVKAGLTEESSFEDGKGALHILLRDDLPWEASLLPYALSEICKLQPSIGSWSGFAILVKDRYQAEAALHACQSCQIPAVAKTPDPLGETAAFQAVYELFSALHSSRDARKKRLVEMGPFASIYSSSDRMSLEESGLVSLCRKLLKVSVDREFKSDLVQVIEEILLWEASEGFSFQGVLSFLEELEKLDPEEGGRRKLESEQDAVQILTLHASKGLEFDVVLALGLSTRMVEEKDEAEELDAEKLRQLYVAMTRAKKRLYVPVSTFPQARGSFSPMELFCQILEAQEGPFISFVEKLSKTLSITQEQMKGLEQMPMPRENSVAKIEKAPLKAPLVPACFLHSFSSLKKEEIIKKNPLPSELFTLHTIPRGKETGICIHQLFEDIFTSPPLLWKNDEERLVFIQKELESSFLAPWTEAIQQMVDAVLHTPLCDGLILAELEPGFFQAEMEFLFFDSPHYIQGVIDLVFFHQEKLYFIDWKTNWLGDGDAAYLDLKKAMTEHDYWLQAKLYKEALERHVKQLYIHPFDEIFGGAIYFFLRGKKAHHFYPKDDR